VNFISAFCFQALDGRFALLAEIFAHSAFSFQILKRQISLRTPNKPSDIRLRIFTEAESDAFLGVLPLLFGFDDVPPYNLGRLITLGCEVGPGLRFVERHQSLGFRELLKQLPLSLYAKPRATLLGSADPYVCNRSADHYRCPSVK
jgi:hypothetical protein